MKELNELKRIEVRMADGSWVSAHWEQLEQHDVVRVLPSLVGHDEVPQHPFIVAGCTLHVEPLAEYEERVRAALVEQHAAGVQAQEAKKPSRPRARKAAPKTEG